MLKILSGLSRSIIQVFKIFIFPGDCSYLIKHVAGILPHNAFYTSLQKECSIFIAFAKHVRETCRKCRHENYLLFNNFSRNTTYSLIRNKCRITKITHERTCIFHFFHCRDIHRPAIRVTRTIFSCEIFWWIWSRFFVIEIWRNYLRIYHIYFWFNLWQVNFNSLFCIYIVAYIYCCEILKFKKI